MTPLRPCTSPLLVADCWAGKEPAELLGPRERELLLFELWLKGWTDVEIAVYMKQSLYTTCRIRTRLELAARHPTEEAA